MFLFVLRLKLLLFCPEHIYFVSLEFCNLFTSLTPQTSACDSRWRCELWGYMKADKSGMALSYLSLMHSQLFQIHSSIPWNPCNRFPYDGVTLDSDTSVIFPKHRASCGVIAFLRLFWRPMTAPKTFIPVMYMTARKGQERIQPWSTRNSKCKVSQAGNLGSALLVPGEMAPFAFLRRKTFERSLGEEGLEDSVRRGASRGSRLSVLSLRDLETQSLHINSGAN